MRHWTTLLALILLTGIAATQDTQQPDAGTVSTPQFTVNYPPGDDWAVTLTPTGFYQEGFPFDENEQSVMFRRGLRVNGKYEYSVIIHVSRKWPLQEDCRGRFSLPRKPKRPHESVPRLIEFYDQAQREGTGDWLVFDLRQCGKTITGFTKRYMKRQGLLAAENARMLGKSGASLVDKGVETLNGREIHFSRYEVGQPSDTWRWENRSYLYFPPGFGEEHLFFYSASDMSACMSLAGCEEFPETKSLALAVLAFLEPLTSDAQSSTTGD